MPTYVLSGWLISIRASINGQVVKVEDRGSLGEGAVKWWALPTLRVALGSPIHPVTPLLPHSLRLHRAGFAEQVALHLGLEALVGGVLLDGVAIARAREGHL